MAEIVQPSIETQQSTDLSTTSVRALVDRLITEYDAPRAQTHYIVDKESGYIYNEVGDDFPCPAKNSPNYGKPVRAKGIMQITDCYHPEITDAQAFDPEWSLRWALPLIKDKKTCLKEWTTCRWWFTK